MVRSLLNMSCIMGIVWVMYSYSGPYLKPILTLQRFLCNILIHNIRSVEKVQRLLKNIFCVFLDLPDYVVDDNPEVEEGSPL